MALFLLSRLQMWTPVAPLIPTDAPTPTKRWTLHIEKLSIARMKSKAKAEHVTVTEVINRIIRHYYKRWAEVHMRGLHDCGCMGTPAPGFARTESQ